MHDSRTGICHDHCSKLHPKDEKLAPDTNDGVSSQAAPSSAQQQQPLQGPPSRPLPAAQTPLAWGQHGAAVGSAAGFGRAGRVRPFSGQAAVRSSDVLMGEAGQGHLSRPLMGIPPPYARMATPASAAACAAPSGRDVHMHEAGLAARALAGVRAAPSRCDTVMKDASEGAPMGSPPGHSASGQRGSAFRRLQGAGRHFQQGTGAGRLHQPMQGSPAQGPPAHAAMGAAAALLQMAQGAGGAQGAPPAAVFPHPPQQPAWGATAQGVHAPAGLGAAPGPAQLQVHRPRAVRRIQRHFHQSGGSTAGRSHRGPLQPRGAL